MSNVFSKSAIYNYILHFGALLKNLLHYTMVQKDMVQTPQVLWGQEIKPNHAF